MSRFLDYTTARTLFLLKVDIQEHAYDRVNVNKNVAQPPLEHNINR